MNNKWNTAPQVGVLVIDEEPAVRDKVARIVSELNEGSEYQVRQAATLAEAQRMTRESVFDVIVSDLSLPDATWSETLSWLATLKIPFVVATCAVEAAIVEMIARSGADSCLSKERMYPDLIRVAVIQARIHGLQAQERDLVEQ